MGYERRGRRKYYYAKIRQGKKVHSRYVGNPQLIEELEQLRSMRFDLALRLVTEPDRYRKAMAPLAGLLDEYGEAMDVICRSLLLTHGLRLREGRWRSSRRGAPRLRPPA